MYKQGLNEACKKSVLVVAAIMMVMAALLLAVQTAHAAGYNHPTDEAIPTEDNPHGGYTNTTNKCKTCHAVHLAQGNPSPTPSYVLLRANSASDECDYCHATGGVSQKIISGGTHGTHLSDSRGPAVECSDCHKVHTTIAGAQFKDGELLTATIICDNCHSDGGAFDGVNDSNYGAKNNWADGVYDGNNLKSGKEKWCASCHDADQASSNRDGTGVAAPDISGDDSTYGYYISGHKMSCMNCHNSSVDHLDANARTYAAASDNYKDGYRLKYVSGSLPLDIPRGDVLYSSDDFALCFSCHDETSLRGLPGGYKDWTGGQHASSVSVADPGTNFRNEQSAGTFTMMMYTTPYPANIHWDHLAPPEVLMQGNCTSGGGGGGMGGGGGGGCHDVNNFRYDSDFDGSATDSKVSCPTCHDAHGTSYPRMTKNDLAITYGTDVAYINSTDYTTSGGDLYCADADCHDDSGSTDAEYYRAPSAVMMCSTCHLGTGDTDNFASDGTVAVVDQTEWETKGHGRPTASGNYPVSGNPAADLDCDDCHDENVGHDTSGNYFRLKNNSHTTWGKNYACQSCHATGETGATVKVDSTHYNTTGGKHDTTNNGGQFCWDCHDPHGDSNIFMVQLKPAMKSDASTTIPTSLTTNNASFSQKTTGTDYAKSSAPFNGVCNVCHTVANHYTDSSGDGHNSDTICTTCHDHTSSSNINGAFSHGDGSGIGCVECHGHDSGTLYDPDATAPYTPGASASQGAGTYTSHSTHTETDSDDAKGPGIYCDSCHDTNNFPYFKSGTDGNGDSKYNLAETDVCDTCHSAGGTYDGVDDAAIGAKNNWDSGVYTGSSLTSGKEKWCASCHDESPSVISSVSAPNVTGDEDGSYTYGTGWGYYKTGHGLPATDSYPASGGITAGAEVECNSCHDLTTSHIDGLVRTYDDGDSVDTDPSVYRQGYRLKQVSGQEPMLIPWKQNVSNSSANYRLCMQSGCHASGPYTDPGNTNTNLISTDGVNRHEYHLDMNIYQYAADWSGGNNSLTTCVSCHNVHGSKRFTMVREGELTSNEPGLRMWYYNPSIVYYGSSPENPPSPDDLPLSASTGVVWSEDSAENLCAAGCHGPASFTTQYRTPFQFPERPPTLSWTGETNYANDGVNPDSAAGGSNFVFRVEYTDTNNDTPSPIQVWVDQDDSGIYEADEKHDLTAVNPADTNYTDGKLYSKKIALSKAGDNTFNYRFYASDGMYNATGDPVSDSTVTVTNNVPTLAWTGEAYFAGDGVNPDTGANGAGFEFRIKYTDKDNEEPISIEVWVDVDDSGTYELGEKYAMAGINSGDTTYSDGKLYTRTLTLAYAGDGNLDYRFYATEGIADATGTPVFDNVVTVSSGTNNPPTLDWVAEQSRTNGVKPAMGLATGDFEFKIKYTDADNEQPPVASDIQVWIDMDDSSTYEAGEKYNLSEDDVADTDCTDGKLYKVTKQLSYAGDGDLIYRFYASDGTDTAIGDPVTTDSIVTVVSTVNTKGVRKGSETGPVWYGTIQAAIDAVDGAHTVLVYEGTYYENLYFNNVADNDTIVRSVCGADSTIITSTGSVTYFLSNSGSMLDGFQITGGSTGVSLNSSSTTVINSKIHGNSSSGIHTGNAGSTLTLTNSEVYSNSAASGGGIYINWGTGHTINNSVIRDNTASGGGGGVLVLGGVTFNDTIIKNNNAGGAGGGVFSNGATTDFYRCIIADNVSSNRSGALELGNSGSTAYLENCIVANNRGTQGGVSYLNGGTLTAVNSTFADNQATTGNGGAFFSNSASLTVRNSILWNNLASGNGHIAYLNYGSVTISDSIMNNDGDGDFTDYPYFYDVHGNATPVISGYQSENDPKFVNAEDGNYHIQSTSDAIDNANGAYAPDDDIDGDIRLHGISDDIGADEFTAANNAPTLAWTGEADYTNDGVNPQSGQGGSSFDFRISYTDGDNTAPSSIQVWVDEDDSGTYEPSEKYDMTEAYVDNVYSDGKLYQKTLTIFYDGDGTLNYRFYASDGKANATGTPISDSIITLANNIPTIAWTGETNYASDGVAPDIGHDGSNFEFRLDYTDLDNNAPSSIEVWVDKDDSGTYSSDEKYGMAGTDGGDTDCTDGKRYTKTLAINSAGDGNLSYTFRASDGTDTAIGDPTSDKTLTVTTAPILDWTGEPNYTSDGVNPDTGTSGSSFEFRIKYTDMGNIAPTSIQVWVDRNDDGDYLDTNEKEDMIVDGGDGDYTNGELYTKTLTINAAGDGNLNYRFYAFNGTDDAIGTPTSNSSVIINNPPTLAWTGETNYISDGVNPDIASDGSSFEFRIEYTDSDNDAPSTIQVWVDRNDDGDYLDTNEKEDMIVDGGDGDYTNGELYTKTLAIVAAGDGALNYRFYAKDAADDATGDPVSNSTVMVTIASILQVPLEYATIQAAIDAAVSGNIIRVSDGTYSENINYSNKNITIQSVNGAAATTIQGSGADAAVVTFNNSTITSSAILDGFTIDNQNSGSNNARGISISSSATPTIKNSTIKGNTPPSWQLGAGIYIDGGGAIIEDTIIGGSVADKNSCKQGPAVYAKNSSEDITITGSTLSYNTAEQEGGAIYLTGISGMTTITTTTISNNSGRKGSGIYSNGSLLFITNTDIDSNISSLEGGGLRLNGEAADATITGGSIDSNSATSGGGVYIENGADLTYTGGSISGNTSSGSYSGGIHVAHAGTDLILTKMNIKGNSCTQRGGGMYLAGGSTTTLTNCTVSGNTVGTGGWEEGGGIRNYGTLNIYSSTFAGNYSSGRGGGLYNSGTATVTNSIFWDNNSGTSNPQIYGTVTVTYTDVEGTIYVGPGNINLDPSFVLSDPAGNGTPKTTGDYHIQSGSPVIDQGTATDAPADDIDGDFRPQGLGYDMGSDEYVGP